ncbi:hypothetical protein OH77DRAFT_1098313 [Trametes cingulata]|nr:hypothetical protein OH77DRAFT_1098313 [Trametes cingulata]
MSRPVALTWVSVPQWVWNTLHAMHLVASWSISARAARTRSSYPLFLTLWFDVRSSFTQLDVIPKHRAQGLLVQMSLTTQGAYRCLSASFVIADISSMGDRMGVAVNHASR